MESDPCVVLVTAYSFQVSEGKLNPERSNTNYRAPFSAFKKNTFQTKSRLFFLSYSQLLDLAAVPKQPYSTSWE